MRCLQSRLNRLESELRRLASRENANQNDLLERIKSMEGKMNSCQIRQHAEKPATLNRENLQPIWYQSGQVVQVKANSENIFEFGYCCATDKYKINGHGEPNWEKYCQESQNFYRKVEAHHNIVYLTRSDAEKRTIEWKFNVPINSKIEKVEITVYSAEFSSKRIIWVS